MDACTTSPKSLRDGNGLFAPGEDGILSVLYRLSVDTFSRVRQNIDLRIHLVDPGGPTIVIFTACADSRGHWKKRVRRLNGAA